MTGKTIFLLAALLAAPALLPGQAAAQFGTRAEEQTFDYDPGEKDAGKIVRAAAETTYEDATLVNHPIYGTYMVSKYRWKNWVTRALYLTLINIALLVIIISLGRTEEYTIIIGYALCGLSATLSFWVFLCAVLVATLGASAWLYVLPVSLILAALSYLVLMKIKKSDISLAELKESFQKMHAASNEDPRLASVSGAPGDWPNQDFLK